jgi:putative ABC transport system permease protein
MGASALRIAFLLSADFARLVLVAFVVGSPLAYLAMERWLGGYAYHIEPGAAAFLLAGGLALGIALLTVGYQALRTALADPVRVLRYE